MKGLSTCCWFWYQILVLCLHPARVNAFGSKVVIIQLQPSRGSSKQQCSPVPLHLESNHMLLSSQDMFGDSNLSSVPIVLVVALIIGFASQLWINRLTQGDDGLGAFLRDGRGYSNSGFMFNDENRAVSGDPLPWLKLPKLDFVEVAGQEDNKLMAQLQNLQQEMQAQVDQGDYEAANRLREELEKLLSDNSMRLVPEDESW